MHNSSVLLHLIESNVKKKYSCMKGRIKILQSEREQVYTECVCTQRYITVEFIHMHFNFMARDAQLEVHTAHACRANLNTNTECRRYSEIDFHDDDADDVDSMLCSVGSNA